MAICSAALISTASIAYAASYGYCEAAVAEFTGMGKGSYNYTFDYDTVTYERSAGKNDVKNIYNKTLIKGEDGIVIKTVEKTLHNQTSAGNSGSFSKNFMTNATTTGWYKVSCASVGRVRYSDDSLSTSTSNIKTKNVQVPEATIVRSTEAIDKESAVNDIALNNNLVLSDLEKVNVDTLINDSEYSGYNDGWVDYVIDEVQEGEILPDDVYIDTNNKKMYIVAISDDAVFAYDEVEE